MLRRPEALEFALERFARSVVKQARANLSKGSHKDTDKLYKSLDKWEVKVTSNSIYLSFGMEEYGDYQDLGVKGAVSSKSHKMKKYTPYKFKDKMPPTKDLKRWANKRGINEFAVAKSIYQKGIPQTLFFTRAFESRFGDLPETILDVFGNNIEDAIKYATKKK